VSPPFFVSDLQSFTYTLSTELPSFRRISGPLKAQVIRHRQRMIQHRPSRAIRVHRPAHHPPGSLFTAGPEFITIVIPTGPRFRKQADAPTTVCITRAKGAPLLWHGTRITRPFRSQDEHFHVHVRTFRSRSARLSPLRNSNSRGTISSFFFEEMFE